jgi:hypothetical protein
MKKRIVNKHFCFWCGDLPSISERDGEAIVCLCESCDEDGFYVCDECVSPADKLAHVGDIEVCPECRSAECFSHTDNMDYDGPRRLAWIDREENWVHDRNGERLRLGGMGGE